MGTIVDKFNYSFEAKDLIKDSINNLGGSITSETELKEYAQELDNIYDNLPKTTGEDTNLSLTTLKGKMNIIPKGDTQQDTTNGYQLIDLKDGTYTKYSLTAIVSNGKVTINGNTDVVAIIEIDLNNTLTLANGQNYTLYGFNTTTNSDVAFRPIGDYGAFQIDFSTTNNKATRTFGNTTTTLNKIGIRVGSGTSVSNLVCSPMLISGSDTSKSYEPYTNGASPNPTYPQNIEVVTGTQNVKVENVNLLKLQTLTEQTTNGITFTPHYENGELLYINVNGTATSTATYNLQGGNPDTASTYPCSIKQGGYTLSGYLSSTNNYKAIFLRYTYDNSTFTTISATTETSVTFTQDCKIASYIRIQGGYTADNEKVYPQLEKGSTATPYTPHQEQTQIVELSSKNILNLSIIGKVPSVTNGNLVDSTTGACSDFIEVDNAKHYMLSFSGLSYMYAFLYGADKSYITAQQYNTSGSYDISTITNFNTCKYVRIRVDNKDYIESPQLEEGSSATPFEEYYNYELSRIPNTNYQDYLYKTSGKNLLNSEIEVGSYSETTGTKITDNSLYRSATMIPILPNTTYTFSINGTASNINKLYYDNNGTFLYRDSSVAPTFTTPNNAYFINIYRGNSAGNKGWQLEKGTQATIYEPYGSDKWYKKEYIGKYAFTSSDNWVTQPYGTNSWVLNYKVNLLVNDSITIIKSNIFTGIDKNSRSTSTNNIIYANDSVGIFIRNTEFTTQAQVQTATTGNYIYYIANTPNDIEITNSNLIEQLNNLEKLKSYNGVTNINCSGNLSAILGISALKGES